MLAVLISLAVAILVYFFYKRKYGTIIGLNPLTEGDSFDPVVLVIDTETTGLIVDNGIRVTRQNLKEHGENFPRIVQLCFLLLDKSGTYIGEKFYIKQNQEIPATAIGIHGITNEKCETEGVELNEALNALSVIAGKVDTIVGHNIKFDYKVLQAEYLRAGIGFPLRQMRKVDTMKLFAKKFGYNYGYKISLYNAADRIFSKKRSWQMLKATLEKHDAQSDTFVTALLYQALK